MEKDLTLFLSPKSIAVIGASRSPDKVGAVVLKNIINSKYEGKVYAVNPNATDIGGIKCFPDVNSLPEAVDLAIVAIPAEKVTEILNSIGEKGIKNVVVLSAGFKEIGADGEKLEEELKSVSAKYNLNLLGPNCMGFVNNDHSLNATFGQTINMPGNLRFITQSGALAASLFDWCQSVGLGFSQLVTLGNKAVLTENDFLEYFKINVKKDPNALEAGLSMVNPIGFYLESISDGQKFLKLITEIGREDPIIIIKPGRSKAAAKAMQSHTGAIAGEDDVFAAALKQAGAIRCDTLESFFDLSRAFAWEEAPKGPRIAIISNAGGPGVLTADVVAESGLKLAEFSDETKNRLEQALPRSASIINPIDVMGDALAERYAKAAEVVLETDQADALMIILTPQMMTQVDKTAEVVKNLSEKYKKPIFCSFIGGSMVAEGEKILNLVKIPSFRFPERAIATIGAMWQWKQMQTRPAAAVQPESKITVDAAKIKEITDKALKENYATLDSLEADKVMTILSIPTPPSSEVKTIDEARSFSDKAGWPVVLKLTSPGLLHKASLGAVVTDIFRSDQLELAWNRLEHKIHELPDTAKTGLRFQIQKDVTNGVEVIVGVKHDPTFGPVLLFGAGGQLAELVADKNIKILPVSPDQVKALVERSKVYKLLQSAPGEPPYALDKLYDLVVKLTQLVPLIPEATDIEINPVIVTHNDVWAVDSKVLLQSKLKAGKPVAKFHTATVVKNDLIASTFRYLEIESEEPIVYKPGQYVSIKVAPNRINSYSIAGGDTDRKFYLLVDTSPGGPGSKFFENAKAGDKLAYMGPFGNFIFNKDDGSKRILFLGTGSGCSPLRAILEASLEHYDKNMPIDFYFGLRYINDVFWQDYFQKLSEKYPNFHFNMVLSKPDESWHGQIGHITDVLQKEVADAKEASAYLCGNPAMIEEASAILKKINCPTERIYTEKF